MKWDWDELFGSEYLVELKNEERKYFCLDPIAPGLETTVYFSKTNLWYKRTTVYWRDNTIIKVITESNRMLSDGRINSRSYEEYDTELQTDNRTAILPLTAKGKPKKVSAANILAVTPFGCSFSCHIDSTHESSKTRIGAGNPRANRSLPIGERERIAAIRNNDDFRAFVEDYIATCPPDYFDRVNAIRQAKHITVKYRIGDVFRIEADRFRYCYGIITGEVGKIKKWKEIPENHSLRSYMTVPIMVRLYDLVTEDGGMTVSDLQGIPLGHVAICSDGDIIWGRHHIIGNKPLTDDDIEFHLICTKYVSRNRHATVFSQELLMSQKIAPVPESYRVHVEWGTAVVELTSDQLSDKLKTYLENYHSPFGGVALGIEPYILTASETERKNLPAVKGNLLEDANRNMKNELFASLGLRPDASFDEFAAKFGGLSRAEILNKLCNGKRNFDSDLSAWEDTYDR